MKSPNQRQNSFSKLDRRYQRYEVNYAGSKVVFKTGISCLHHFCWSDVLYHIRSSGEWQDCLHLVCFPDWGCHFNDLRSHRDDDCYIY